MDDISNVGRLRVNNDFYLFTLGSSYQIKSYCLLFPMKIGSVK